MILNGAEFRMSQITIYSLATLLFSASVALAQDTEEDVSPLDQVVPVADEAEPELADETATEEIVTEERLLEEFARYRRMLSEGTLDEADVAAKRIVEMAIQIYGPRSSETASALNNLAIVQHSSEQYDAAIQNFQSSVEILEGVDNNLAPSLVNPLKGLGAAQLANGRPDRANRTFNRAAHITQVNEGPHNIGQVEILESIAETFLRMGDIKSARRILDRIHILNVRFYEKDPMGLIPSLMNRASWQHRAGYYADERASYRRAIRIIEAAGDKNDPMLIEPLRRLGNSFYYIDVSASPGSPQGITATGELYFKRAVRIAEKNDDLDWQELIDSQLALADFYIYSDAANRAHRIYREVWQFLDGDADKLKFRNDAFAAPLPIRADALPGFAGGGATENTDKADIKTGTIVVEYSVTQRGRVRNLRTEALPPVFTDMQRMVHREIRGRAFRPAIVDGEAVQADGLVFEHEFSYRESDREALQQQMDNEAAARSDSSRSKR